MTIETKFQPGDSAWLMHENKALVGAVKEVSLRIYKEPAYSPVPRVQEKLVLSFVAHSGTWEEHPREDYVVADVFKSKEELLASL